MVDEKLKSEVIKSFIELTKPMTPKERGEFVSELTMISLKLVMDEHLSPETNKVFKDMEKEVS